MDRHRDTRIDMDRVTERGTQTDMATERERSQKDGDRYDMSETETDTYM